MLKGPDKGYQIQDEMTRWNIHWKEPYIRFLKNPFLYSFSSCVLTSLSSWRHTMEFLSQWTKRQLIVLSHGGHMTVLIGRTLKSYFLLWRLLLDCWKLFKLSNSHDWPLIITIANAHIISPLLHGSQAF